MLRWWVHCILNDITCTCSVLQPSVIWARNRASICSFSLPPWIAELASRDRDHIEQRDDLKLINGEANTHQKWPNRPFKSTTLSLAKRISLPVTRGYKIWAIGIFPSILFKSLLKASICWASYIGCSRKDVVQESICLYQEVFQRRKHLGQTGDMTDAIHDGRNMPPASSFSSSNILAQVLLKSSVTFMNSSPSCRGNEFMCGISWLSLTKPTLSTSEFSSSSGTASSPWHCTARNCHGMTQTVIGD